MKKVYFWRKIWKDQGEFPECVRILIIPVTGVISLRVLRAVIHWKTSARMNKTAKIAEIMRRGRKALITKTSKDGPFPTA
jgi:hypothetical protein